MMSTGATITGTALTVGNVADATSLAAKSIDAAAFNGSREAATNQLIETTLNFGISKMANKVAGSFIRTNSAGRFINSSNGQFVSNRYSFGITATRDATSIIVPLASPNKTGKIGGN
jgi:small neutral amino acid transporter SnatA (MarC family)